MGQYKNLDIEQQEAEQNQSAIDDTLNERGDRYGRFATQAALSQTLHNTIMKHYFDIHGHSTAPLPPYIVEALSMICHKLARVANGDPLYDDNWRDIAGYSQLVLDILNNNEKG